MDAAEALVKEHLFFRGFTDVVHEPDGNRPPDFVADSRVAVEVRRLNQHHERTQKPLAREFYPLLARVERLLGEFEVGGDATYWLSFHFHRPVPSWKRLEPALRHFLTNSRAQAEYRVELELFDTFSVALQRSEPVPEGAFVLGVVTDMDAGGCIVSEVARNLQLCLDEKARKVAPYRLLYPEWWLVLVDHVGYSMSEYSRRQFQDAIRLSHDWDRVVLVRPGHSDQYFDLPEVTREA